MNGAVELPDRNGFKGWHITSQDRNLKLSVNGLSVAFIFGAPGEVGPHLAVLRVGRRFESAQLRLAQNKQHLAADRILLMDIVALIRI